MNDANVWSGWEVRNGNRFPTWMGVWYLGQAYLGVGDDTVAKLRRSSMYRYRFWIMLAQGNVVAQPANTGLWRPGEMKKPGLTVPLKKTT